MLSLRQIEVIRAVLLTGSISGAARMLNVSPPSVSRMLRHSESQAGMEFFERSAKGFIPRPEIKEMLRDFEDIHDGIRRVNRRLEAARRPVGGRISIGASPGLGVSLVPAAIAALLSDRPEADVIFNVLHREEFVPQLLLQAVDLALAIFDLDDPRIDSVRLAEGSLVCLVHRDHPLAARDEISLAELEGQALIGFNAGQFQQVMIDRLAERAGVTLTPVMRVRLTVSALFMAASGAGVALLDSFTVHRAMPETLRVVPLRETSTFSLRAFHSRGAPLSQVAEAFLGHVRNQLPLPA